MSNGSTEILIVEDNAQDLRKVKWWLKGNFPKAAVRSAKGVREALTRVGENGESYDLYIVDQYLLDGTGVEFISELKKLGIRKKAVGLTRDSEPTLSQMRDACAAEAFCKNDRAGFLAFVTRYLA